MSESPLQILFQSFEKVSKCVQTHLSHLTISHHPNSSSPPTNQIPPLSISKTNPFEQTQLLKTEKSTSPSTKEELGRSTWTFLHTLGAQYPDSPTRQQKKDVKELMAILSRMYPCKECADHFKEVLRANPVQAGSHAEFSQWLCHVHNVVNRSLGKLIFPCERVDARWGKLECEQRACDLHGTLTSVARDKY